MKIVGFEARADLVGRRVRVRWSFVPEGEETVASVPHVLLRRKLRDFSFPPVTGKAGDPFEVYSSRDYPADGMTVTELPPWEEEDEDGLRVVCTALSESRALGGRQVELRRRTVGVVYGRDGAPVRQRVEVLDLGGRPGGLPPGQTCYYQLFSDGLSGLDPAPYQATATPGEAHGLNRTFYEMLPAVHRRHDVKTRPVEPGCESVPEMMPRAGQLRRMIDVYGMALDSLRSSAEGLLRLHDVDQVDHRYLELLSRYIGWDLSHHVDIPLQRNEIKIASLLYRGIGTVPNIRAVVSHYTGWFTQVAEFGQNLLCANQPPQRNIFCATLGPGPGPGNDAEEAALVTLEGAPGGRLCAFVDRQRAVRLFYETAAPGSPAAIRYKTFIAGAWRGSRALLPEDPSPRGAPAAVELQDGRLLLFWVDGVHAAGARVRVSVATPAAPQPARLLGSRRAPFALSEGAVVTFTGSFAGEDRFVVRREDYAQGQTGQATAAEVAQAIVTQCPRVRAWAQKDGTLAVEGRDDGPAARLRVALASSTCARALGLHADGAADPTAQGSWDDGIALGESMDVPGLPAGRYADLFALRAAGGVRLFHAVHHDGIWRVQGAFCAPDRAWAATAAGVAILDTGGPSVRVLGTVEGLPSKDVRALALDEGGALFCATAAGVGVLRPDGVIVSFTSAGTGGGLPSDDVRGLALRQDGALVCATAAGVAVRAPDGTWSKGAEALPPDKDKGVPLPDGGVLSISGNKLIVRRRDGASILVAGLPAEVRALQGPWSAPRELAAGEGGSREPCAALDGQGRIVLAYAQRQGAGTAEDTWLLRARTFDPKAGPGKDKDAWGAEVALTSLPAGAERVTDREPALLALPGPGQGLRVSFRSDRTGGTALWSVTVDAGGAVGQPVGRADDAAAESWPAPLRLDEKTEWLLFRSDRNLALSQVAGPRRPQQDQPGSLRRYAGSISVVPGDLSRLRGRRRWGDYNAYTPQRPDGGALNDEEYYTPNTIGLYVSRDRYGSPLTPEEAVRLRELLGRLLPMNLRAVLILLAGSDTEVLYPKEADIGERYEDRYPFSDAYAGVREERITAALPGWEAMRANTEGHVSADPEDLSTLRRRSFYPPPR